MDTSEITLILVEYIINLYMKSKHAKSENLHAFHKLKLLGVAIVSYMAVFLLFNTLFKYDLIPSILLIRYKVNYLYIDVTKQQFMFRIR